MSELKAFRIIQGDTGGYGAPSYKCDTDGNRIEEWSDACEVYDRFEADKAIEDLEESHKMEVEQLLMEIVELKKRIADGDRDFEFANNQNERLLKIVRHQKHKRCEDMVAVCCRDFSITSKIRKLYWMNLWQNLADKYKEMAK